MTYVKGVAAFPVHALGITYRQLDYWTRVGYIAAENPDCGPGHARRWSDAELTIALRMGRLSKIGVTLALAARIAREGTCGQEWSPGVRICVHAPRVVGGQMVDNDESAPPDPEV